MNNERQQIMVNEVANHVSGKFGLDDSYLVTDFKAKNLAVTLSNSEYDVTVKVKNVVAENLMFDISTKLQQYDEGFNDSVPEEEEEVKPKKKLNKKK